LLFLPDRVGRSARVTLSVRGDLGQASALSGSLRVEARRLLFPGHAISSPRFPTSLAWQEASECREARRGNRVTLETTGVALQRAVIRSEQTPGRGHHARST